jgi:transposase-like protein
MSYQMLEEKAMTESEAAVPVHCEKCDQASRHVIKSMGRDNQPHYVCWSCLSREEKRFNLKETWKRGGRAGGRQAS